MRRRYFLLFILGLTIGIFFGLKQVSANAPTSSGGETSASVVYDEVWNATEALVSKDTGYTTFTNFGTGTSTEVPSGRLEKTSDVWEVKVFPKMLVTKWKVHGHVHFH